MKKLLAILLAMTMLLSLGVFAHADKHDPAAELASALETATGIGEQIKYLAARFKTLKQDDEKMTWRYAVTDLDHNGRLELLANAKDAAGSSSFKAWEISPAGDSLVTCTLWSIPAPKGSNEKELILDNRIMNLLTNSVDTYYDAKTDTYYYSFTDAAEIHTITPAPGAEPINAPGVLTGVGVMCLKNGSVAPGIILGSCLSYSEGDGDLKVVYRNGKAEEITKDEYLSLTLNAFPNLPRFNTAFDWFTADEATTLERFVNSYATFDGVRDEDGTEGGVEPVASQSYGGVYITKNPTDEKLSDGQTAEFIANANIYDDVTWTFIAPDGRTYNEQEFVRMCGGVPEGTKTGDLKIKNVNTDMNGWGVFATFDYRGASARTSTAYFYVWANTGSSSNYGVSANAAAAIDQFYNAKPWLDAYWSCPLCNASVSGSQCWSCGFNPTAFYSIYYGVTPENYSWYYGVNGSTPVSAINPAPIASYYYMWTCPACGRDNRDSDWCGFCGYHYGDPVGYNYQEYVDAHTMYEQYMGAELRTCQYCGNYFNNDYECCPYCGNIPYDGTAIGYDDTVWNTIVEMYQGADLRECQYCGQYFNNDYDSCPYCGNAPFDAWYDDGWFSGFTAGGNARYTRYDDWGNEYCTVICPYCGYEHSMATNCPVCGGGYT